MTTARAVTMLVFGALLCGPIVAKAEKQSERRYVLIVAQNRSLDKGVNPLRFADDDGARYWELFSPSATYSALLSVLDPDTAKTHVRAARAAKVPWARNLKREVSAIREKVERDNRKGIKTAFTFIYIGHGNVASDGEGYINLQDMRLRRRDLFQQVISRIPAQTIHLIVDACKSYFVVARGPKWKDDRSGKRYAAKVRNFFAKSTLENYPHVGAIVSTSGNEDVHEWSAFRSGVFSHQLRSGLAGAADINGDGRIEYSELGAFIAAANQRVSYQAARLRPYVRPPPANRHAVVFSPHAAKAGPVLEFSERMRGRFTLEDDRGVRIADLNKARGVRVRLAVAAQRRHYVRHGRVEFVVPRRVRGSLAVASLDRIAQRTRPRGALDDSYRAGLFAVALDRSFYNGYVASSDLPSVRFGQKTAPSDGEIPLPRRLRLDLAYGVAAPAIGLLQGLQHSVDIGLRYRISGPFYVALRGEFGISRHSLTGLNYSLLRVALIGGIGARYDLGPFAEVAAQFDAGYQALIQTGQTNSDFSSAKFGGQVVFSLFPWSSQRNFGITARAGLYGHLVTLVDEPGVSKETITGVPEGGLGLSYRF